MRIFCLCQSAYTHGTEVDKQHSQHITALGTHTNIPIIIIHIGTTLVWRTLVCSANRSNPPARGNPLSCPMNSYPTHIMSLHTDIHNMSAEQTSVPATMLCMSIDISLHGRVILCSSCLSFYLFFFSLRRGRIFRHANMTGTVHSSRMQSIQNMLAKARVSPTGVFSS